MHRRSVTPGTIADDTQYTTEGLAGADAGAGTGAAEDDVLGGRCSTRTTLAASTEMRMSLCQEDRRKIKKKQVKKGENNCT
jgi:hypothetical protein